MKLRGHHLFCTALFSGHGYDEAFTKRMGELIKAWQAGETACLTCGTDDVCAACPNRTEAGGCDLGTEDVLARDKRALEELGFSSGALVSWKDAQSALAALDRRAFDRVCGHCRWQEEGLCSWELLHKKTAE